MKNTFLLLLLILAPSLVAADAAPAGGLSRDLGRGLAYFRAHTLPADLPVTTARHGALILDLRYTLADTGATAALGDWLKAHCTTTTPVLVLLNASTAADVLAWFNARDPMAGLLTLGIAAPGFVPDVALRVHPAAERAAYDALEHGTPVETLLTDPTDKPRHDEAAIAQERSAPAEESADEEADVALPGEAAPIMPAAPRPVIDYTLLRAVQLHRSLLALRKL